MIIIVIDYVQTSSHGVHRIFFFFIKDSVKIKYKYRYFVLFFYGIFFLVFDDEVGF